MAKQKAEWECQTCGKKFNDVDKHAKDEKTKELKKKNPTYPLQVIFLRKDEDGEVVGRKVL